MNYRVVFDVSERLPAIALGVGAAVLLAGLILAGILAFDRLLPRWTFVLAAGGFLAAATALVQRNTTMLLIVALFLVFTLAAELSERPVEGVGRRRRTPPGGAGVGVGLFMLVFAAFVGLAMIPAISLAGQLADGQAVVVEGPVRIEDFGKSECIDVADRRFCYSNANVSPGFNRMRGLDGPLRDGMPVRLSVIGDTIVRVEVADPPAIGS